MNDLLKMKFFRLISEPSSVTNPEMLFAYEDLVRQVQILNQSEMESQAIFRTLNITRIELQSLQTQILREQGKKCTKKPVLSKSNLGSSIGN